MIAAESRSAIQEAFALLHPNGSAFEVRIPFGPGKTHAGYFCAPDVAAVAVEQAERRYRRNIYCTVNPVLPDLMARGNSRIVEFATCTTKDAEIVRRWWLPFDVDAVRPAGVSSTADELAAALARRDELLAYLRDVQGWPAAISGMSGNGGHGLLRLDLPNDDETAALIKTVLEVLSGRFSDGAVKIDTVVYNASRIWKVPGTLAVKGDSTDERPHRRAFLEAVPAVLEPVSREQLREVAALGTSNSKACAPARSRPCGPAATDAGNLRRICEASGWYLRELTGGKHAVRCPWSDEHSGGSGLTETVIFEPDVPGARWGFKCQHEHCADRTTDDVLVLVGQARPKLDAGNHNLPAATAGLMKALEAANEPPELFRFGGVPVRLERDEHGAPRVCLLTEDRMRHHAARAADWVTLRRKNPDAEAVAVPALPPVAVVRDVLASPDLPFPVLERIVQAPCFGADGRPHLQAGYLAGSRLYLALPDSLRVSAVPERPTPAEIEAARLLLADDLLGDFPFTTLAERAHALAVALAPFLRELIDGPTPLFLIEKPAPGTGASLLADVLLLPATGRPVGTMTEGRDEDEWRKRLTAKLASGPAAIVIDNLRRPLEASCLASAITATVWEDRLLGGSTLARLPVRCAWLATGNNPRLSNEMARRTIRIRLDAAVERPWLRTGFRYPDLRGWVLAHRGELIHAALVIGQAWIAAGRPMGARPMGMFESWAGVMGGALDVAGVPGFLGNLEEFYEASDGEADAWRELVERWRARHGADEVGVGKLWPLVNPGDVVTAPVDLALGDGSERSQRTRFGALLRGMRGRVIAGSRIEAGVKCQGAQLWRLTPADR